jgi:hypothetical protein
MIDAQNDENELKQLVEIPSWMIGSLGQEGCG